MRKKGRESAADPFSCRLSDDDLDDVLDDDDIFSSGTASSAPLSASELPLLDELLHAASRSILGTLANAQAAIGVQQSDVGEKKYKFVAGTVLWSTDMPIAAPHSNCKRVDGRSKRLRTRRRRRGQRQGQCNVMVQRRFADASNLPKKWDHQEIWLFAGWLHRNSTNDLGCAYSLAVACNIAKAISSLFQGISITASTLVSPYR